MMTPAEARLLHRARDGDTVALGSLAQSYWPAMRRWAYVELADRALAEDACQDALLRLVRFIDTYQTDRPFEAWLRALVRNASRELRTRRARRTQREARVPGASRTTDLEHRIDLARTASRAFDAFRRLPERQRQLVELVDRQGMSPTEAAAELRITAGAVRSQLFAARRALRAHLVHDKAEVLALLREP